MSRKNSRGDLIQKKGTMMRTPINEQELNDLISQPWKKLIDFFKELPGDISILGGANGKIGLSLSLMAKKAIEMANVDKKLYAVSRFSSEEGRLLLESHGITTIACDLSNREEVQKLPKTENVIFMAGRKFGTEGAELIHGRRMCSSPPRFA